MTPECDVTIETGWQPKRGDRVRLLKERPGGKPGLLDSYRAVNFRVVSVEPNGGDPPQLLVRAEWRVPAWQTVSASWFCLIERHEKASHRWRGGMRNLFARARIAIGRPLWWLSRKIDPYHIRNQPDD